tara:strand:- start:934 stop:1152 length:219 start_codon:yes stop_codon:yes gene_type:complete
MTVDTNVMLDNTQKFLAQMLEGYEKALPEIEEFIKNAEQQLNGAKERKEEILASTAELKELLDLSEEAEQEA